MNSSVSFQSPRKLRVFAFDPSYGNRHVNRRLREMVITVPWELDPVSHSKSFFGPDGEYLQVVDYDPASGVFYEPINLNDPEVLYNAGLTPSEENPQFHQQMIYAVAMNTIAAFEQALGRFVLWAPRKFDAQSPDRERYVGKLRIYPHALREANAFYDPDKKALLFGYFTADSASKFAPPKTTVFTCLSHDIIVHETCHAILDGMHPRFVDNSNPDMLALHEAFADIVALFQHFSYPQVLEDQIARTRGDLQKQSLLGALAQEFGQALGHCDALRDALGHYVDGEWKPREPDNKILNRLEGPHARGAIMVAAVFRAFLSIYQDRVADLFRIASGGSGLLKQGEIDPDLVKRLAGEAAKSARHILRMCIRAMDYIPPVNIDFGDYLRAIITADHDLYPEDDNGYRRAVIEAFTAWGIYPGDIPVITENALLWPELREAAADLGNENVINSLEAEFGSLVSRPQSIFNRVRSRLDEYDSGGQEVIARLERKKDRINQLLERNFERSILSKSTHQPQTGLSKGQILGQNLLGSEYENGREAAFAIREFYAELFWGMINSLDDLQDEGLMRVIGVKLTDDAPKTIRRSPLTGLPTFEVHSVRMASRLGKRGQKESEYVVEIIQSRDGYFEPDIQKLADEGREAELKQAWQKKYGNKKLQCDFRYRCGCTLLIDTKSFEIRRVIRTQFRADQDEGLDIHRQFLIGSTAQVANAFDSSDSSGETRNAFANLHRHVERGVF